MKKLSDYLDRPIYSLQTMLRTISDINSDILPLIPDGIFGPHTFASVRSFQNHYGLSVTGVVDLKTWEAIVGTYHNAKSDLRELSVSEGAYHPAVAGVQAMLFFLSDQFGEIPKPQLTGTLDEITQKGLQYIQKASGLEETGLLNQSTLFSLQKLYAHYYIKKLPLR